MGFQINLVKSQNPLRILHIAKYYPPDLGGMETAVREISLASKERGFKVRVLASEGQVGEGTQIDEGIEVFRFKKFGSLFSQPISYLGLKFWTLLRWADIIHLHTPNPLAEALFYFSGSQKPFVISHHCDVLHKGYLSLVRGFFYQKLLKKSHKIVASNEKTLKTSLEIRSKKNSISIPFGVSPKNEESSLGSYAIFVGRLVSYKGLQVLVRAWKNVKGPLKIVGEGPQKEELLDLVKFLNLEKKVQILGALPEEKKWELISKSRFLILPSISPAENFGISLIEAMSFSKPVISTELGTGTSWINQDGRTGFVVPPNDEKAIQTSANQIFENNELAQKLGQEAGQRVNLVFSREKMGESWDKVYREAFNHHLGASQ